MTSSGRPVPSSGWKRVRVPDGRRRTGLDAQVHEQRPEVVSNGPVALLAIAWQPIGREHLSHGTLEDGGIGPRFELDPIVRSDDLTGQRRAGQPHVEEVDQAPAWG